MPGWTVQQMDHDKCLYRFDGPLTDERRSITFVYMNVDDIESITTELDLGLDIMRQFNLKYIVRMCPPQLLQLRRECGFKTVKMRKPDLMESMIVQLYDQAPIQATAPKHAEAKGHRHEPLQTRVGNVFSGLTSMKDTTENMDRCQKSDMGNTHGMNGDFIKTNCRLYVQGQT